ncbi:MAG: class I SAM-dependent methyltransferase [Proteobacteria bacterium]|nr:class I SAM-dependent methyltransferase [Pseudomonadota bacterium]
MTDSIYQDATYLRRNPHWHEEDSPHKARWIKSLLDDHRVKPKSVCEVGCGAGEILAQLQITCDPGTTFIGYEIAPDASAINQAKQNGRLRFAEEDFLESKTETFDLLLLIDVFEHVEDYIGFLRQLRSRARQFVFHIPLDLHVSSLVRVRPLMSVRESVGHLHYFTRETALATLADAGFKVIDERFTAGALELPQTGLTTRLMRLPRCISFKIAPVLTARWLGGFSLLVLAEPNT